MAHFAQHSINLVGVGGFEPPISCTQNRRLTGLGHTPRGGISVPPGPSETFLFRMDENPLDRGRFNPALSHFSQEVK